RVLIKLSMANMNDKKPGLYRVFYCIFIKESNSNSTKFVINSMV
ncbi:MAG: hypothetical protein ACI9VT_004313, partial [Psychroserpens sp.]